MKAQMIERTAQNAWIVLQSAVLLLLLCSAFIAERTYIVGLMIAAAGLTGFAYLFLSAKEERARIPNLVTALRLLTSVGVFLYVVLHGQKIISYTLFLMLVCIEITDFVDGYIAKKVGPTAFGATWDMEADAYFLFLLSFIAHFYFGLGSWVLLIGAIRYIFAFVFTFFPRPSRYPPVFRLFAKGVCVFAAGALISLTAPFATPVLRIVLNAVATACLLVSFLWETGLGLLEQRS